MSWLVETIVAGALPTPLADPLFDHLFTIFAG